jgi:hypothetical protein
VVATERAKGDVAGQNQLVVSLGVRERCQVKLTTPEQLREGEGNAPRSVDQGVVLWILADRYEQVGNGPLSCRHVHNRRNRPVGRRSFVNL